MTPGKMLIAAGALLVVAGLAVLLFPRIPFLGKLPGDIVIKREDFTLYFPLMSSVIISVLLSLILWLFRSK